MKQKTQKYFSIFLIFLIASTELSQGKSIPKPLQKKLDTLLHQAEELNALQPVVNSRQKRAIPIATILFTAALVASFTNLAIDIYATITNCCGFTPAACTYRTKFLEEKEKLMNTSDLLDAQSLHTANLVTYLTSLSLKSEEISQDVEKIAEVYETLIQTIDPTVLSKYEALSLDIQLAVEENNATILNWEYEDLDFAFDSAFDSTFRTISTIGGIVGPIFTKSVGVAIGYYKTSKIQALIETNHGAMLRNVQNRRAVRMLSGGNADDLIKQTAKVRFEMQQASSRATQIFNIASSVLSLVKLGIEIYVGIKKIMQCIEIRDTVKDAYDQIVIDNANIDEYMEMVQELHTNVTTDYSYLLDQLKDEDFLGYLEQVKNMTDSSSVTAGASANIQKFIDEIPTETDPAKIEDLQEDLISSLETGSYTLSCLQKKMSTFTQVEMQCEAGEDHLQTLFDETIVNFETDVGCVNNAGVTYTQYSDLESYISSRSASEGYNADCVLNDPIKLAQVCDLKCNQCGTTCTSAEITTIANSASITDAYATKYIALCPTYCPITPLVSSIICMLKSYGMSASIIQGYLPIYDAADIQTVMASC